MAGRGNSSVKSPVGYVHSTVRKKKMLQEKDSKNFFLYVIVKIKIRIRKEGKEGGKYYYAPKTVYMKYVYHI